MERGILTGEIHKYPALSSSYSTAGADIRESRINRS